MQTKLKAKKCRVCEAEFFPPMTTARVCSINCAIIDVNKKKVAKAEKEFNAETRRRKEKLKTRSDYMKEAQKAFNYYIRMRDYGKPCISSGRQFTAGGGHIGAGGMDAGHYRSVGAAAHLRFNCWNCHAQSVKDNRDLSGNVVEYRIKLIERIGLERVERLENDNTPRKFDIDYLKRVRRIFRKRGDLYKRLKGIT